MELILDKQKLFSDLNEDPFKPHILIDNHLSKQYPNTYNKDVGVWEKYTLRQHTIMVLRQFEKYFSHQIIHTKIKTDLFRLILAVHDIGKPESVLKGEKHKHHSYNKQYVDQLFKVLQIDSFHTNIALTLVDGDPIGKFIRKYSIDELPQLFNILFGSMTLIGPRPPVPSEVSEYKDNH